MHFATLFLCENKNVNTRIVLIRKETFKVEFKTPMIMSPFVFIGGNMYNNPYAKAYGNNFNQQNMNEQIDYQINQLQQMKEQMKNNNLQQPAINQTFQLAPTNNHSMKYANTIDEVAKEVIFADTPFFSKDMSVLWVKSIKGEIKTYELNEIVPKDDKDMQIEYLMTQIEELKGMIKNDTNVTNANAEQDTTDTSKDDEPVRNSVKEEKPSSISRVSTSKKK